MTSLVVDANVALAVVTSPDGLDVLAAEDAVAPPLLRSEVRSALHVALTRGLIDDDDARRGLEVLESGAIGERRHRRLGQEAWRIADRMSWAKTYDAEYLALAALLSVPIATFDRRMLRAAEELGLEIRTFD
jgi:predicted nucleic acid-binding protein